MEGRWSAVASALRHNEIEMLSRARNARVLPMKLNLQLTSLAGRPPLTFRWDSDAGEVTGESARLVLVLIRSAVTHGTRLRGIAEGVRVTDPLHSPADMALVLGRDYGLPPELEALYPEIEDTGDAPAGTVF